MLRCYGQRVTPHTQVTPTRARPATESEPVDTSNRPPSVSLYRQAVRVTTHLVIWSAFLVTTLTQMANGWRPFGDNAYVAFRSNQVFSLHPPLVGTWSSASSPVSHTFYTLGPLWFWLLAIPVHLDPAQGTLWGSALWCAAFLSLAAEAVWRTKGWVPCAVVGLVVVDLLWLTPQPFADPPWNAFFGLFLLVTTMAIGWVVATGSLGWWPAMVLVASVEVQSHMFYVLTATALVLGAPLLGIVRRSRPERFRWLAAGLIVGVACWVAPMIQEVTGHPGNMSLLVTSGRSGASVGATYGLRTFAGAATLPPIWLRHYPTGFFAELLAIQPHAPMIGGVLVILGVFVVTAVAWATGHRDMATLAAIALVSSIGLVASVALLPLRNKGSMGYLIFSVWVVGAALWLVVVWSLATVIASLIRRKGWHVSAAVEESFRRWAPVSAVAVMVGVGVVGLWDPPMSPFVAQDRGAANQVRNIATAIEQKVDRGPVSFQLHLEDQVLSAESLQSRRVRDATSTVWQLTADGWQTGIPSDLAPVSNPFGPAPADAPQVIVTMRGNTVVSAVVELHRRSALPRL